MVPVFPRRDPGHTDRTIKQHPDAEFDELVVPNSKRACPVYPEFTERRPGIVCRVNGSYRTPRQTRLTTENRDVPTLCPDHVASLCLRRHLYHPCQQHYFPCQRP